MKSTYFFLTKKASILSKKEETLRTIVSQLDVKEIKYTKIVTLFTYFLLILFIPQEHNSWPNKQSQVIKQDIRINNRNTNKNNNNSDNNKEMTKTTTTNCSCNKKKINK